MDFYKLFLQFLKLLSLKKKGKQALLYFVACEKVQNLYFNMYVSKIHYSVFFSKMASY